MIVADILMWFLLIAGTYTVINGYWMTTQGLFPEFVDRCRERIRRAPFMALLFGLAGTVPAAIIGVALFRAPSPAEIHRRNPSPVHHSHRTDGLGWLGRPGRCGARRLRRPILVAMRLAWRTGSRPDLYPAVDRLAANPSRHAHHRSRGHSTVAPPRPPYA